MKEKIIRNYLEIKSIDKLLIIKKPNENYSLECVSPNDFQLNKFFYKQIGKNYHWIDRLVWTDKNWIEYISNTNLLTFVLKNKEEIAGFFELTIGGYNFDLAFDVSVPSGPICLH